jgi:hypothetical protein
MHNCKMYSQHIYILVLCINLYFWRHFKCHILITRYTSLLDRDDIQPLPGPRLNPEGTASVRAVVDGAENSYRIGLANVPAEIQL